MIPATANARHPYELRLYLRHNQVMIPGRTKMPLTGRIKDLNAVVRQVPGSLVMKAVMYYKTMYVVN